MSDTKNARIDTFYTPQYGTLIGAAHTRPTQEIGAPTLIWHISVWPKSDVDPENIKFDRNSKKTTPPKEDDKKYSDAIEEQNKRREKIVLGLENVRGLNTFLEQIQKLGRIGEPQLFKLESPLERDHLRNTQGPSSLVASPETLAFTLWWKDSLPQNRDIPGFDPIRVRVQIEVQPDYFSITFFIDIGKCWNAGSVYDSANAPGRRRRELFRAIERIKEICDARFQDKDIELPLLPLERKPPQVHPNLDILDSIQADFASSRQNAEAIQDAADILKYSKYLYSEAWEEFCHFFDFTLVDIIGPHGRVFANFRGLILPTDGLGAKASHPAAFTSPGKERFPKFGDDAEQGKGLDRRAGKPRSERDSQGVLATSSPNKDKRRQPRICGMRGYELARTLYNRVGL